MKHYIIVKLNEEVKLESIIKPIQELFNQALNIDGIFKIDVIKSNSNIQNRHDLMIIMYLTKEALKEFDNSYIHKLWKEKYGKYIISKTIFDCDLDDK